MVHYSPPSDKLASQCQSYHGVTYCKVVLTLTFPLDSYFSEGAGNKLGSHGVFYSRPSLKCLSPVCDKYQSIVFVFAIEHPNHKKVNQNEIISFSRVP